MKIWLLPLLVILGCGSSSYARIGIAEIYFETPGKHGICHCDPYGDGQTPVLYGFDTLQQLEKWYFYRMHIVGKGKGYYFIFDEAKEKIQYFRKRVDWQNAIHHQNLEPLFTRWLDLSDTPDFFLVIWVALLFTPLTLIVLIVMIVMIVKRKIGWNKRTGIISLVLILMIIAFVYSRFNLESV